MPNVSPPPSPKTPKTKKLPKRLMEKHLAKQANLVACNATAKNLFTQSEKVKMLEEEIGRLCQQLQDKEQVSVNIKSMVTSITLNIYIYIHRRKH